MVYFKLAILLFILCLFTSKLHAQEMDIPKAVNSLISEDDSTKSRAVRQLISSEKPVVYPLLSAIYDQKLFQYGEIFVTYDQKSSDDSGIEKYSLYQVYPVAKALMDENGKVVMQPLSSLKEVKVSRSDRLLIAPLAPYLNLVSADAEKRKLAYNQFQNLKDKEVLPKLAFALENEKNSQVYRLGKESYYCIQLNTSNDAKEKMHVIDLLVENWGPNTESILEQYAETEKPGEIKNYALAGANGLKKKHDNLRMAQNFFSGLSLGSILIMIALGLSIIYGLAGVINMAHGEFLMIGAYATFVVQNLFGKDSDAFFWFSLPISFLVAGIFGFVIERLIIRHLYSRPLESLLATWGVSLVLVQLARTLFGDLTAVRAPDLLSGGWEIVPHLILPYNRLFIILLSLCMILLTYYVLYRTRLGLRVRAVTQNRKMSSCLGIETNKVDATTFFLGSGLAGIAGCAMTLIGNVVPDMGQNYIVDSFLVVVTGGVGNIAGSIVSGFGIGFIFKVLESFFEAVYGKVFILVLIILFLQFKPKGLFPDKGRIGDD